MKYYLIAGEASGELHASMLMQALAERDPQACFRFWGGEKMEAVYRSVAEGRGGDDGGASAVADSGDGAGAGFGDGADAVGGKVRDYRDTAVMGVVEVLAKAGSIRRNLAFCKRDLLQYSPDVLILIDYPGFNLKMARFAHSQGIRVFYYIAPKVWASREGRTEQIRRYVDRLFVIFPFEVEWFRTRGIEPVYEGNPLVDSVEAGLAAAPSREEFLRLNGLDSRPLIALLPGSRLQEIKFLAPRFRKVLELAAVKRRCYETLHHKEGVPMPLQDITHPGTARPRVAGLSEAAVSPECPDECAPHSLSEYQFVIAAAPGIEAEVYSKYFPGIPVVYGQTYALLKYASAAAVASGTASLEAAIIGTPQVVCYGTNPVTFSIAKALMKGKYVSLPNLIMDRPLVRELLQGNCTPEAVSAELERLVNDADAGCHSVGDISPRSLMQQDCAVLRARLGTPGAATRLASAMYEAL